MNCQNCIYKNYRRISPSPIKKSRLAIVGMNPGTNEIAFNKPFVGPSGEFLNDMLAKHDLPDRSETFVTNAILCKPPDDEQIKKQAILNCQERLISELKQVQPEVILALGNVAMHALSGKFKAKITNVNGIVGSSELLKGIKIVPAFHPAAISRNPGFQQPFEEALTKVKRLLVGDYLEKPQGINHIFTPLKDELEEKLNWIIKNCKGEILGCDIETTGLKPYSRDILYVGVAYKDNEVLIFYRDLLGLQAVKDFFSNSNLKFSWQNGQFDTIFLNNKMGIPARIDQDTMILHYCLNSYEGYHDLDTLSMRYLGVEPYSYKTKKYMTNDTGMKNVPREILLPYLAKDCAYTKQLIPKFLPKVEKDKDLKKLYYRILIPGTNFLRDVQWNGFYAHKDYCLNLKDKFETKLSNLNDNLIKQFQPLWEPNAYQLETRAMSAPEVFNPGSIKQLGWMIYDRLKLKPRITKSTNKGKCVDKDILNSLKGQHEAIDTLLEYRSVQKTLSTYISGVLDNLDDDSRIRSQFWLTRTSSGRLASRNPNLQNIDRRPEIKNIFGAPEGKILIEADYKAIELRMLAYLSKDKFFTEAFKSGKDPHDEMAKSIYGDSFTKEQRVKIKGLNFGIAYGRGPESIAEEFGMSIGEAKYLIRQWFERAYGAKHFLNKCEEYCRKGATFVTIFGRKLRFGSAIRYTKDKAKLNHLLRIARNFPIQSPSSDLTFLSAMEIHRTINNYQSMIVNLVHDSVITEAPNNKKIAFALMKQMKNIMEKIPQEELHPKFDFPVEFSIGTSWGNMKRVEI